MRNGYGDTAAAASLRIDLLGRFHVVAGLRPVEEKDWRLHKARSLVKLLALARDHRLGRDEILDLLWPDSEPEAALNSLHRTLHVARRALDPAMPSAYLPLSGDVLALSAAGEIWIDVEAFGGAATTARRAGTTTAYRAALDLYAGDLLPDDRYEDWATARREELRELYLALLVELGCLHRARGEPDEAIAAFERVVAAESAHEEAHAAIMGLHAAQGRRSAALRQYQRLRDALRRELAVEPDVTTQRLYDQIAAGHTPASPAASPGIAPGTPDRAEPTQDEWPAALPRPSNSFVGRERELGELVRLLPATRLLTLTGTGGSGKTRLALHTAAAVHRAYTDGVRLVELAAASDEALVVQAVAAALGLREEPGRPLVETLAAALRSREMLLILDNCEHVVAACSRLAGTLLRAAPNARLLATSREPLGVPGETLWPVPALLCPDPARLPGLVALAGYDAVRLFLDRARVGRPGFTLTERNAAAVAQICHRLDGIPLAIELAAARVPALAVEEIAARLDNVFAVLPMRRQAAVPHHRTLRAAIDWSHDLLSEPERVLLRRLSVFAGGWTLQAVEAVASGAGLAQDDVLNLLAQLIEKSLVVADDHDGAMRYHCLEPLRQYAREKLAAAGDTEETGDRHAAWCLRLAEEAEPELTGPQQGQWLDRLEGEHDNVRAALSWLVQRRDTEAGLRLSAALWRFWFQRGYMYEGRGWLQLLLVRAEESGSVAVTVRAAALSALGSLAFMQGDYVQAAAWHEQSLALRRDVGTIPDIAGSLNNLGNVAQYQGDYAHATALHEESLTLRRQSGDRWGIAISLSNLASVAAEQGNYAQAIALLEESLALRRDLDDTSGVALAVGNLGILARYQGQPEQAALLLEESLDLRRRLGDTWGTANALANLGSVAVDLHAYRRALMLYQESLALCREIGDKKVSAFGLEGVAAIAAASGDMRRAARLASAAAALREAIGAPLPLPERRIYEQTLAAIRTTLDENTIAAATTLGRALPWLQAVEEALAVTWPETPITPRPATDQAPPSGAPLSGREREIAALVAAGWTNRQIATELGITERTVGTHVGNILSKLGLASRTEVAGRLAEANSAHATH